MITSGVLLIEGDAPRPRCFEVEADSHPNAWMSVKQTVTPQQLEKELSAKGWTFFFMAGLIRVRACAFNRDKAIYVALKRGIKATREQRCNCLQIEAVEMHSFLGIPCVSMSIRPRHIQREILFAGPSLADRADITAHELRRNVAVT